MSKTADIIDSINYTDYHIKDHLKLAIILAEENLERYKEISCEFTPSYNRNAHMLANALEQLKAVTELFK